MYQHKYLFTALLKDGTTIQETPDDKSQVTEGKNAFWDVLQKINEVQHFCLWNSETGLTVSVDLSDGHFEIDYHPFTVQNPSITFPPETQYRLIYFRRVTQTRTSGGPDTIGVEYHIGWQVTVEDKNYQYTLAVK